MMGPSQLSSGSSSKNGLSPARAVVWARPTLWAKWVSVSFQHGRTSWIGMGWLWGTPMACGVWLTPLPFPTAKVEQVKFDATTLHAKPQVAAQQKMVDDGSGEVEVG